MTSPDMLTRPSIWDVVARDPVAYASDINGGFVVLRREQTPPAASGSPTARGVAAPGVPAPPSDRTAWIVTAVAVLAALTGGALLFGRKRSG
ncbi:MAG: hypothetical protein ACRDJM_11200 [Actinomycetota bacterium]